MRRAGEGRGSALVGRALVAWVLAVSAVALTACADERQESDAATWRVDRIIDGDTIVVTRAGVEERVRLIGMDTPERGECGFDEATQFFVDSILGEDVTLQVGATTDRDVYERLLRYVEFGGQDMGLAQIEQGLAVARYDSRTNQPHPREQRYRDIDDATPHICDPA